MPRSTSWGNAAPWYHEYLRGSRTYQKTVILPNLLRMLNLQRSDTVVDLACGDGFFVNMFAQRAQSVIGVDVAQEFIEIAKRSAPANARFVVSPAHRVLIVKAQTVDVVTMVSALETIDTVEDVMMECARMLKPHGRVVIVMNHPAFRVPKASSWQWDAKQLIQYRRVDAYLSQRRERIEVHPGKDRLQVVLAFHRPLQWYMKIFRKSGFCLASMEEWISDRQSQPGPRAQAEDRARKEIPLFLCLELCKKE